ncbi:MAG TPA: class I SAM-dependent methyltransferase [Acidimicrobiales bacterium]|nr:class I SAM-dependent methyltransferase [Acidimicrobiales bacterium]
MAQFHWDPATYRDLMRTEVPAYEELQDAVAGATRPVATRRVLDLGTGTGETANRVLALHDDAFLVGVDESDEMLTMARRALPAARVELRVGRLQDPLPVGPFEVVVSVLAVHHLDGTAKAELFGRVHGVLKSGGRFVLGDVVVPDRPGDAVTPVDGEYDRPDTVDDQLRWLGDAGFEASVAWQRGDLAVMVADRPG